MKKKLSFILAVSLMLCMALAVTACGGKAPEPVAQAPAVVEEPTAEPESVEEVKQALEIPDMLTYEDYITINDTKSKDLYLDDLADIANGEIMNGAEWSEWLVVDNNGTKSLVPFSDVEKYIAPPTFDEIAEMKGTEFFEEYSEKQTKITAQNYFGDMGITTKFTDESKVELDNKSKLETENSISTNRRTGEISSGHPFNTNSGEKTALVFIVEDDHPLEIQADFYPNADYFDTVKGNGIFDNGEYIFDLKSNVQDTGANKTLELEKGLYYLKYMWGVNSKDKQLGTWVDSGIYNYYLVIPKSDAYTFLISGKLPGFEDDEKLNEGLGELLSLKSEYEYLKVIK